MTRSYGGVPTSHLRSSAFGEESEGKPRAIKRYVVLTALWCQVA